MFSYERLMHCLQILSNLDVEVSLQIVRTNKYLRELFFHKKKAKVLWETVRYNMPDLQRTPWYFGAMSKWGQEPTDKARLINKRL